MARTDFEKGGSVYIYINVTFPNQWNEPKYSLKHFLFSEMESTKEVCPRPTKSATAIINNAIIHKGGSKISESGQRS